MQRYVKFIGVVLAVVLAFTVLTGCSMFARNQKRYRAQIAAKIGNQEVSLKDIMDFFDVNGANYINYGYDAQTVWDALFPQYIAQIIGLDQYKANFKEPKYDGDRNKKYTDGGYLKDSDLLYFEKQVQNDLMTNMDTLVETEFKNDGYIFSEDKGDARPEHTEIIIQSNLTWTSRATAFDMKALDKKLDIHKKQSDTNHVDYIFTDKTDARLIDAVKKLNDRKTNEKKSDITVEMFMDAQFSAEQEFIRKLIISNYEDINSYFITRVELLIRQQIYQDYQNEIFASVETDKVNEALQTKLDNLVKQAKEGYDLNAKSFETFVTGLTKDSFIYAVPAQYEHQYGFVKNMLLPFSADQTTTLTAYKTMYGVTSSEYLSKRAQLSQEIKVTDFIDAPKAEDEDKALAGFTVEGIEVIGSTFFEDKLIDISAEKFVELMFRYNTDTAQHNSTYDYVIAKQTPDATGTKDKWVKEFATVARRLANDQGGKIGGIGYALTDYGVHIIFYAGDVVADSFDWATKLSNQTGAGTPAYRFYKLYYEAIKNTVYSKKMDTVYKEYETAKKINVYNNVLKEYCEGYGIKLK
ncbi:MAG: hypothetical protein RR307_04615 [Clostridia bacterium]